jgi:glycosyltransferase involved in cell wall biosynthesis
MDGASTDGTVEILKAAGDTVTWRSEPDRGQCEALNKAFSLAKGEIIGWLNSDDAYFDCDVVRRVVACFQKYPGVDAVYGHAVRIAEDGRVVWVLWTPKFKYRRMQMMNFLVQPTVFIRRSALGDFIADEAFDFTMDWELWLRLGKDHRFKRLNSVLAADRHQPGRKNKTAIHVFRENERRMRAAYGFPEPSTWYWDLYQRYWWIRQRLMGGFFVRAVSTAPLAFDGRVDPWRVFFRRQVMQRRTKWAAEDIETS